MCASSGEESKKYSRVLDDVLVEGGRRGHEDADRRVVATPRAAGTLPGRGYGSGISGHHHGIQGADVDPELEGVRGNHPQNLALAKLPLDLATLLGEVASAVAPHGRVASRPAPDRLLEVPGEHLRSEAVVGEHEGLPPALQEDLGHAPGFVDIAAADSQLLVHHRRVVEDEVLLAARSAVVVNQRKRFLHNALGQLLRIGDRCRAADELRLGAVKGSNALEPPQNVGQMAPEHAAVGVQLVHDDVAEVLEEAGPAGVMRQDAGMQHVRVAEDDIRPSADRSPRIAGSVPVVGVRSDIRAEGIPERVELFQLVDGQGLRGKQVEGASGRVGGERVQHGQVVAERLAAGSRSDDHDVLAAGDSIPALGLVHVRPLDSALGKRVPQAGIDCLG